MTVLLSPEELTLDDLVADPTLEEIWINGPNQVFVAEGGVSRPVTIEITAPQIRAFVERVLRHTGRRGCGFSPTGIRRYARWLARRSVTLESVVASGHLLFLP